MVRRLGTSPRRHPSQTATRRRTYNHCWERCLQRLKVGNNRRQSHCEHKQNAFGKQFIGWTQDCDHIKNIVRNQQDSIHTCSSRKRCHDIKQACIIRISRKKLYGIIYGKGGNWYNQPQHIRADIQEACKFINSRHIRQQFEELFIRQKFTRQFIIQPWIEL